MGVHQKIDLVASVVLGGAHGAGVAGRSIRVAIQDIEHGFLRLIGEKEALSGGYVSAPQIRC